jgi:hypothetical protein
MTKAAPPWCPGCGHLASSVGARFCSRCGRPLDTKLRSTPDSKVDREAIAVEKSKPEGLLICRARCSRSKQPFALKFERGARGIWFAKSSWIVAEKRIGSPIFSSGTIRGHFRKSDEYGGCPYCQNSLWRSCFKCNLGLGCLQYGSASYICPWCGASSTPNWGKRSRSAITIRGAKD